MKRSAVLLALVLFAASFSLAADIATTTTPAALPCGAKLYLAPMPNNLDAFIRSRLVQQHAPVKILMTEKDAEFIMTGNTQEIPDHWYAGATRDRNVGAVTIADAAGNFIWSASAGDRNIWWGNLGKHGPEKVAQRIVEKMSFASCK